MFDWKDAIKYGQMVGVAYDVAPSTEFTSNQLERLNALGYRLTHPIIGSELATDTNPQWGAEVLFGYIAESLDGTESVTVLRGTESLLDWLHDLDFIPDACPIPGADVACEDGFGDVYKSLRVIDPQGGAVKLSQAAAAAGVTGSVKRQIVTGHSLGAALGTILAADMAHTYEVTPIPYLFAPPRVGMEGFRDFYKAQVPVSYLVCHESDIVPKVPLWPYHPVHDHISLPANLTVKHDVVCDHVLETYLWLMAQQTGDEELIKMFELDVKCQEVVTK